MGLFKRKSSNENKTPPAPLPPAMDVRAYNRNSQREGWFDANKFAYDVDTNTGLFYAVTFYSSAQYHYYSPAVTHVPYSKEVFEHIPEGKRDIYLAKFGDPEAAKETETQQTLNLLLQQVKELTSRLPSQPASAPRQQKNAGDGPRLRLG